MSSTISKCEENCLRMWLLVTKKGTWLLRQHFLGIIGGYGNLVSCLATNQQRICKLRRRVIGQDQYNLLYPTGVAHDIDKFDLSLWSFLIKNIKVSNTQQVKLQAVNKIRELRNSLAHQTKPELSDAEFNRMWKDMQSVATSLGASDTNFDEYKRQSLDRNVIEIEQLMKEIAKYKQQELANRRKYIFLKGMVAVLLAAVVYAVWGPEDYRDKLVYIKMLPEAENETTQYVWQRAQEILKVIECENVNIIRVERLLNTTNVNIIRPVELELESKQQVQDVLRNKKKLKAFEGYSRVYLEEWKSEEQLTEDYNHRERKRRFNRSGSLDDLDPAPIPPTENHTESLNKLLFIKMLPEADNETKQSLQLQVKDIFEATECENVTIIRVERINTLFGKVRPVKIELQSKQQVQEVLRNMHKFLENKDYSALYLEGWKSDEDLRTEHLIRQRSKKRRLENSEL